MTNMNISGRGSPATQRFTLVYTAVAMPCLTLKYPSADSKAQRNSAYLRIQHGRGWGDGGIIELQWLFIKVRGRRGVKFLLFSNAYSNKFR